MAKKNTVCIGHDPELETFVRELMLNSGSLSASSRKYSSKNSFNTCSIMVFADMMTLANAEDGLLWVVVWDLSVICFVCCRRRCGDVLYFKRRHAKKRAIIERTKKGRKYVEKEKTRIKTKGIKKFSFFVSASPSAVFLSHGGRVGFLLSLNFFFNTYDAMLDDLRQVM